MAIKTNALKDGSKTYTVRWYDAYGVERTKTFTRKTDAAAFEVQSKKAKLEGVVQYNTDRSMMFREFAEKYLDELSLSIKPRSLDRYRSYLDLHLMPLFENYRISRLKHEDGINLVHALKAKSLSNKSINGVLTLLKQMTKHAANAHGELKQIPIDPLKNVPLLKLDRKDEELAFWEKSEVAHFIEKAKEHPYYDFYLFILNTGLRIGEAAGLTVNKVDIKRRQITISQVLNHKRNGKKILYYFGSSKNGEPRILGLNDSALAVIKERIKGKSGTDLVFQNHNNFLREVELGDKVNMMRVIDIMHHNYEYFTPLQKKIKTKKIITVHGLRHTFASHYMMNGGQLYDLSKLLGHKSIGMTTKYAHLAQNYMQKTADVVQF